MSNALRCISEKCDVVSNMTEDTNIPILRTYTFITFILLAS